MSRLTDEVGAFAGSQHFLLLDDDLKDGAEPLLGHWCEQVGDVVSEEAMERALKSVARLDAPLAQRRAFPRLLREFLEYLPVTGRFPLGGEWAQRVDSMETGYQAAFRPDGSVRGETVRRRGAVTGRNDPCPCGSGRKFKKCCMAVLGS